ncbi:MAG: tRNA (N6-isopentenyl adenosine(37)-C2)-methylthiotransferase MiaB [Dehalococcoidia bacterium]
MMTYHIWTVGCQMNVADSQRLGAALERLGCSPTDVLEQADIVVLNSCVVRQGAEDKVAGRLNSLKPLKRQRPDTIVALMGCMVGPSTDELEARFPHADVFMRPQEFGQLIRLVEARQGVCIDSSLPLIPSRPSIATFVPIIHGCDKFCTFCIIPYRRGRERSRPIAELVEEVEMLARRGVKEVTLLGQNVDSYGHDLPGAPDLADLLEAADAVPGIRRVRFLTSHPNDMSPRIVDAVARLDKVCEYVNLPVQAGDNAVLKAMRRGYTREQYLERVGGIRSAMPEVGLTTDVIVGFPGESDQQFQRTVDLVREVRFDKVHIAMYSPRPGTIAWRRLEDDVPLAEKKRRHAVLEAVQAQIAREINADLIGTTHEVLIEGKKDGRWHGRTRSNKLVYVESGEGYEGEIVPVEIIDASPYSLQGKVLREARVPLPLAG